LYQCNGKTILQELLAVFEEAMVEKGGVAGKLSQCSLGLYYNRVSLCLQVSALEVPLWETLSRLTDNIV
jgi:hypothetical protein